MDDREEELRRALGVKEDEEPEKKRWYATKINWGFWVLIGGFILFAIFQFIIRPRVGG